MLFIEDNNENAENQQYQIRDLTPSYFHYTNGINPSDDHLHLQKNNTRIFHIQQIKHEVTAKCLQHQKKKSLCKIQMHKCI